MTCLRLLILLTYFYSLLVRASPTPCTFFTTAADPKTPPSYDIAKAYSASDLVVIGNSASFVSNRPQDIHITKIIKGNSPDHILLEGIHESGTDPWGSAISTDGDYLLFLKSGSRYSWVDGGSGCPNSFKVYSNKITLGKIQVEVKNLKSYFESNPKPFPMN